MAYQLLPLPYHLSNPAYYFSQKTETQWNSLAHTQNKTKQVKRVYELMKPGSREPGNTTEAALSALSA